MAEFNIVSQRLDAVHTVHGPVSEELRTLQVKRPMSAVVRIQERAQWEPFGKAKVKVHGLTEVLREDIVIEAPSELWGTEEEDKTAHRLVTSGKANITVDKNTLREGVTTPSLSGTPVPGSNSRRNSGSSTPVSFAAEDEFNSTPSRGLPSGPLFSRIKKQETS